MLTYNVQGKSALPIRALPFFSPGFFDPVMVMHMLVDVESYGDAPGLRPFTVDKFGQIHPLHPLELKNARNAVVAAADIANLALMLEAMPADVMVWLSQAKAMYDFLDEQYWLQESRSARPEIMRHWFTQPYCSESVRQIVLADKDHMARTGHPKPTGIKKRQRDTKGSNADVQTVADRMAKDYYTKHKKWPQKKALLSQIRGQLPDRSDASDETIMREFKATWKKSA